MKYMNLKHREIKELIHHRTERILPYLITLILITIVSCILLPLILESSINLILIVSFVVMYISYAFYINQKYIKEIICKQKKVFQGIVSLKSISQHSKKRRYILNMDGRIFYVRKTDFECINEGDMAEFHVSYHSKHLFRVVKVAK